MSKFIRTSLMSIVLVLTLVACNLGTTTDPTTATTFSGTLPALGLTIQVVNATDTFNTVGKVINYRYVVTNAGSGALAGPVTLTDDRTTVTCPNVNTVGNLDNNLDQTESITCTSSYSVSQADLNAGSVTNNATASVGGVISNSANAIVRMAENKVLTITKSANPTTYNQAGQVITFSYVIKNTGTLTLGPDQFKVTDDRITGPVNCDAATKTLASNDSIACTATYTIAQNDMTATQIITSATASGGGAGSIQPASVAITNTNVSSGGAPSTSLTRGSTIQHKVVEGEWMIQIARCYGADFTAVRNANPQVTDAHWITPGTTLTVPNIGSNGTIYGPVNCVQYYTVQSGDTWGSIAQKYNADILILQEANRGVGFANGVKLKVPTNSAGGTQPPPSSNDSIRITFPTGATTVTLSGSVNPNSTVRYLVNANQGQTLSIKVTATANEVGLGVTSPVGVILKPLDATLTWNGILPANGDHLISIASILGAASKSYTLEVSLTSPVASAFERVADIKSGAGDSNPSYLSVFNGAIYFKAEGSDGAGAELWKFDGTTKAASRVADINPGAAGSEPAFLTPYNSYLYFKANGNDGAGAELWRYNGSSAGRLPDINSGAGDANPAYLAVFNNALYFSANGNDGAGVELWKTEGNFASRVADIYNGAGDSNPAYLAVFNNALYFSAISNDGAGIELWKYDGTNTTRVSDINLGVGNSNPAYLTVFNGALYFSANGNDGTGNELWKYDGTTSTRVADINSGAGDSVPAYLTVFNGALYFSANGNDSTGFELWKYNGTSATRVSDINKTGDSNPAFLAVYNNELYFQANGGDGAGKELWKFKGP